MTTSDARSPGSPLRHKAARLAGELLLTVIVVGVVAYLLGMARAPDLPDDAPEFALLDLDNQVVRLSDYRGKTVVLNFWATWCGPCRFEIPAFSRFAKSNPDIVVIGVAADGSAEELRDAARELGLSYKVLMGTRKTLKEYGVETFPTTVVVGPDGDVRSAHVGVMLDPQLAWATR